jgi:3-dehydroquinate synthase
VPTTLLAQVDSGLGGKTGVDLEEGKNLLGTFHQPDAVWVDPSLLATLPPDEFRQGMAEVIKMALLGDPDLWQFLETRNESLARREPGALTHVIGRCCRLKAEIVEADEREGGKRRILNLGHTVGHALERLSGYRMRHGDAVAIGMVCAARLAERLAGRQTDTLTRLEALCTAWALPTRLTPEYSPHAILEAMKADKKSLSGKLHFLVPFQVGQVVDCESPDPAAVDATLRDPRIRAERL